MGKYKLEYCMKKRIFLAPKSYTLTIEDDTKTIKHKGPSKDLVTPAWFKKQLEDPSLTEQIPYQTNFRINWKKNQDLKK